MRYSVSLAAGLMLALLGLAFVPRRSPVPQSLPATAMRAPVVVELFTSEGCSSCPPADALLAKLEKQQPIRGVEIVALEEHVDYWNHDGWTDPFSSEEFTSRQAGYAEAFRFGSVYTPQMIVDGRRELVGSNDVAAHNALVEAAGQAHAKVAIKMEAETADSQPCTVSIEKLTGVATGDTAEVWLAITEKELHSAVSRGENAGEDLHHSSVLRSLRKIGTANAERDPSFNSAASLRFERSWKKENMRVVVFVQEKKSRRILGAAVAKVTP